MERLSQCKASASAWARARVADLKWLRRQKTTYPMVLLSLIALCLNSDQNLIAPNLTQIAREFNFTDDERDYLLGGQLTLGFFIVGGLAAMFVGAIGDRVNRRNLFCLVVLIVTGVAIGGATPLIMSMIGDMFDDRLRGKAISFVQIMLSLGIIIGQSVAGFIGPEDVLGWRIPFVVIACPSFILVPVFFLTTKDPPRGSKEKALQTIVNDSAEADQVYQEKMDWSKLGLLLRNKTAILSFIQGIPGSLPWGVMLVFFQDFLVQNIGPQVPGGITVQQSTTVVLAFGAGSGIGLILGGVFADKLWMRNPRYVPMLMCVTTAIGSLPIFALVNGPVLSLAGYAAVTLPSGILASITGTAIRTVLMNVTLPETRSTAFAFHTLFDDIGRGVGPLWVSLLITNTGGRIPGFNFSIGGWLVCSVILFIMIFTVRRDFKVVEERTQAAAERQMLGLAENRLAAIDQVDASPLELSKAEVTPEAITAEADAAEADVATNNQVRSSDE